VIHLRGTAPTSRAAPLASKRQTRPSSPLVSSASRRPTGAAASEDAAWTRMHSTSAPGPPHRAVGERERRVARRRRPPTRQWLPKSLSTALPSARQPVEPSGDRVAVELAADEDEPALALLAFLPAALVIALDDHVHALHRVAPGLVAKGEDALHAQDARAARLVSSWIQGKNLPGSSSPVRSEIEPTVTSCTGEGLPSPCAAW
jgi:hypothetical protein